MCRMARRSTSLSRIISGRIKAVTDKALPANDLSIGCARSIREQRSRALVRSFRGRIGRIRHARDIAETSLRPC